MHDEFGYLGGPGAMPKRAVTAQMLRDLISFHSSLPVDDQWQTAIWINLLEPFAEVEDIPPLLGDSRPGAILNLVSARRNSSGPKSSTNTPVRRTRPHVTFAPKPQRLSGSTSFIPTQCRSWRHPCRIRYC